MDVAAALMRRSRVTLGRGRKRSDAVFETGVDQQRQHVGCDPKGDPHLSKPRRFDRPVADAATPDLLGTPDLRIEVVAIGDRSQCTLWLKLRKVVSVLVVSVKGSCADGAAAEIGCSSAIWRATAQNALSSCWPVSTVR